MKTKQTQQQEKAQIRDVKSRRTIKLLLARCPLCHLRLTQFSEVKTDEGKEYFQLVQYGANPDGTGYESYHCQFCDRFFMMIISQEPIVANYEFKNPNQQKPKGGMGSIFEEIFGAAAHGGNGRA